jgi:tRNA(fMet)-specific endonuclease VapC
MKYLLDANICIYLIQMQPEAVIDKFKSLSPGEIALSTVTVAEMMYGIEKSQYKNRNKSALELFLAPLVLADFDFRAAQKFGSIRAYLESKGTPIGAYDLMIAAQALSLGLILVTNGCGRISTNS